MSCRDKDFKLTFGELLKWSGGECGLSSAALKKAVGNVWMDSRKVEAGDLFVAVAGEKDDGHNHVASAFAQGAVAALVAKKSLGLIPKKYSSKLIVVKDPLAALQKMAKKYRDELDIPIVAVTGSNGKTTTSRFLRDILSHGFTVGSTKGNFNNHLGVPISVLALSAKADIAVLELGANHAGEIDGLSKIVSPDHAVITNIGYAHVGEFGGIDNTAKAKFEIANGLPKKGGLLIVNGDDSRCVKHAKESGYDTVLFGFSSRCTFKATKVLVDEKGTSFSVNKIDYRLNIPGRHFVLSVLPAIFEATLMGMENSDIVKAVAGLEPDPLRGRIASKKGLRFIVDCYNANPSSMSTGLQFLADVAEESKRGAIIGDMMELGKWTPKLHVALGREIVKSGVTKLVVVGQFAAHTVSGAIDAGMNLDNISVADNADDAVKLVKRCFTKGDTVLLKGSRAVGLEKVFENF